MSDEMFIEHCSPTLAELKTGNMFTCPFTSLDEVRQDIRRLNAMLRPKGLLVLPLRFMKGKVLIYLFRPAKLDEDLMDTEAARLLTEEGYGRIGRSRCLTELIRRMGESGEFPHEIGLFLSYPPEDVRGFIENHAAGCKHRPGKPQKALSPARRSLSSAPTAGVTANGCAHGKPTRRMRA